MAIKVVLVDDHLLVRQGLSGLLDVQKDIEIVGQAGGVEETKQLLKMVNPDVIVMDIQMPDGNGFECCLEVQKEDSCRVLLLSAFVDKQMVMRALEVKAAGYLLKVEGAAAIIAAIRRIYGGQTVFAPEVNTYVTELVNSESSLTPRENEILSFMAKGLTNKEIGKQLYLSEKTVRNYVSSILNKLGVSNRTEAAFYWYKNQQS